jgi:endogenous inhibitor of DNA gyrase (YacG/DUF329 family)
MSEQAKQQTDRENAEQEACRSCGGVITLDAETYPFCSARCRGADLLGWFDGRYKISRDIKDSDIDTVD